MQLCRDEQSGATHLADRRASSGECVEPTLEILTGAAGVLEKVLVADDMEHCQRRCTRDTVASVGVEVVPAFGESGKDLGTRGDGGDRMSVAHGLAHRHEVRD